MSRKERIMIDGKVLVGELAINESAFQSRSWVELPDRAWITEQILQKYEHLTPEDTQPIAPCGVVLLRLARTIPDSDIRPAAEARSKAEPAAPATSSVIKDDGIRMRPVPAATLQTEESSDA